MTTNLLNSKTPTQCVILCGGLGERLLPYTKEIPKPMILCNGKPFLWYLLDNISAQGIKKFCLLTGYLSEKIKEYFKDGKQFGWEIEYSDGATDWKTGKRLWRAKSLLEDSFLLMYSDNFSLINLNALYKKHKKNKTPITFSLFKKERGNVAINKDQEVLIYKNNRNNLNLDHVEIGYMIIDKQYIFSLFKKFESDFSKILEQCAQKKILGAFIQKDFYYSVSDPVRWKITENYLTKKKIILIDRDGVINKKSSKGRYVETWDEFEWINETVSSMKKLSNKGFNFIVITNQAGINRGIIKQKELVLIHNNMKKKLEDEGIKILEIYHCPHHWDEKCDCRKPNAGMFFKASNKWLFRLDKTVYIGDDSRDMEAAINAGCSGIFLGVNSELKASHKKNVKKISSNLEGALNTINNIFGEEIDYYKNPLSS